MITNIILVFIFWTIPCIIFYIAPFGANPSAALIDIIAWTNLAMYAPCIAWFLIPKSKCRSKTNRPVNSQTNVIIQALILTLNLAILQSVGFTLGIQDDSIRTTIYDNAGVFWSLLVALYSISFVLLGMDVGGGRLNKNVKNLSILNSIIFFSYGMKAGIVQIILSFMAGWLATKESASKAKLMRNLLAITSVILLGFWAINSLRAKELIPLSDFVNLIYLYIAPNFQNFSNILDVSFKYEYFLGGVFGGIYKLIIPGYYDPLSLLSIDYLEHQTWNVWSYLSTFYVSGQLFEVYFGSLMIGIYVTGSLVWYRNHGSLLSAVNISQVYLLLLFLHNQYYYSSFAPYLAIGLTWLMGLFVHMKKQFRLSRINQA